MTAYKWLTPASKPDHEIGVEMGGCDGSPHCAGAVHIRQKTGDLRWLEVHLTPDEIWWLRRRLKRSLAIYDSQSPAPYYAPAGDEVDTLATEPWVEMYDVVTDRRIAAFPLRDDMSQVVTLPATADTKAVRQYRVVARMVEAPPEMPA